MKILVVNAGSSSVKYQLIDMDGCRVMAKGICEKIGLSGMYTHKRPGQPVCAAKYPLPTHGEAIALVLRLLTDPETGVIASTDEIGAVGHRFAHGGKFASSRVLSEDDVAYLTSIIPINPLHGPPAIRVLKVCRDLMPGKPQVGVFDTSFYSTLEPKAYIYALPYEWYEKYGIRRYGFHGTSHRFTAAAAAETVGRPLEELKIITCHLGSGSSITAVRYGVAVDTTMGFTPQEGVPMGTRCGSIDPSIITYMMKLTGRTPEEMDYAMNQESGLWGLSGVSSDAREIWDAVAEGNKRALLSMEVLCHSVKKVIGSFIAELNGVDVIAFTAGLGENDQDVRAMSVSNMESLGILFDKETNDRLPRGAAGEISLPGSPVRVLVVPTNEELMIARDTEALTREG